MMAYLLDSKEVCHVKAIFDSIERSLGTFSFSSVFSLVLTDRGGEFRNPAALECGPGKPDSYKHLLLRSYVFLAKTSL